MKTAKERFQEMYPRLERGQQCILDKDTSTNCTVTVVWQTESKLYTTVTFERETTWDVMTNRLTIL